VTRRTETDGMNEGVLAAVRRFPSRREAIEMLAAQDEDFRSLCEDLAAAIGAHEHWRRSADPRKDLRADEYRRLSDELAAELAGFLDDRE
jgi:hypothetical protein